MPKRLTPNECLERAEKLVSDARSIPEPIGGNERGRWVVHRRSLLGKAEALIKRENNPNRRNFDREQIWIAMRLVHEIDALWPKVKP